MTVQGPTDSFTKYWANQARRKISRKNKKEIIKPCRTVYREGAGDRFRWQGPWRRNEAANEIRNGKVKKIKEEAKKIDEQREEI